MIYTLLAPDLFKNPINIPSKYKDWPAKGCLAVTRGSVMVINHAKRHYVDSEPRSVDAKPGEFYLGPRASVFHEKAAQFRQSLLNRILNNNPLWITLAEECKALFKSAQLSLDDQDPRSSIYCSPHA